MPVEPFDPALAAVPDAPVDEVLELLRSGPLEPLGIITDASNATYLCRLGGAADAVFAVYKPEAGERPLWDFPPGLHRREAAAFEVSAALGWGVVPPTVERDGPAGPGSLQLFVPHEPSEHYFSLVEDEAHHEGLARLALFDLLVNNADRKGGHVLLGTRDLRIYGIDNGLCFHVQPKLRTVVWDLGAWPVPASWTEDLRSFARVLDDGTAPVARALDALLAPVEVTILRRRATRLQVLDALPDVPDERRSYPWPPL